MRIVLWGFLKDKIIFHVCCLILASMPVVGSSRTTTLGFPIKLIANESLLFIPPEKVLTSPALFSYKFTEERLDLTISSIFLKPFNALKSLICC